LDGHIQDFVFGADRKSNMAAYVRWRRPSWMEVRVTGHTFENWPLKDHPCHACFKLAYWFQRRRFLALIGNPTWLPGPIMCSDWSKFKKSSY
jgi:hypothetical protein